MTLKVKAIEKLQKIGTYAGTYRYVMAPELYSTLDQAKVIKEAALRSGVNRGVMQACWDAAGEVIKAWATEGHSVALPGLGSMRFGLRAKSVDDVNKVKTDLIKTRRIIFTPDVDLKDELANTSIQITCYDREGNEVKRVTSESGSVEDPETSTETGSEGGSEGTEGTGSGSSGTEGTGSGSSGTGSITPDDGGGSSSGDAGGSSSGDGGGDSGGDSGNDVD